MQFQNDNYINLEKINYIFVNKYYELNFCKNSYLNRNKYPLIFQKQIY